MFKNEFSPNEFSTTLRKDLCRLARFGANISDAHSCLIFLPSILVDKNQDDRLLDLLGIHSLSTDTMRECQLTNESGLIGWVARHKRTIHVSPFEYDSRTLGVYTEDKQLKSFIGIPIVLTGVRDNICGVIACDSKKSFAFSKLQGKLLEELAAEVANSVKLRFQSFTSNNSQQKSWQGFIQAAHDLISALGPESIDVLRIRSKNFELLEKKLGPSAAVKLFDQVERLIQQSLPPHFPLFNMPNGDLVLILDNMMTKFYENKILALSAHVNDKGLRVEFEFFNTISRKPGRRRLLDIEQLIRETCADRSSTDNQNAINMEQNYEFRRA